MIITIDGPSGTGKSTVAKGIAKKLGYTFFDTGAMYRSLAWFILHENVDPKDLKKIEELLPEFAFEIRSEGGERHYFVRGKNISRQIRTQPISWAASQIAVYPTVREAMVKIQRDFGKKTNAVFEGRDMGTVVFPDAAVKIFLTANAKIRAERRYRELIHKFPDLHVSFDEILKEIEERDHADSTRTVSPLKKAQDATLIDTSKLTIEQVIEKIISMCPQKQYPKMKLPYKIVYWIARCFFKMCFRLKIYGLEHFSPGSALIASNHVSLYDPQVLSISCPEEVHFLAKGSLFKIPLFGSFIKILNAHPVARGSSDAVVFRMMIDLLQKGNKLILFPEGQRSETGDMLPFQRGLSLLAQKAECPIIPAYIQGTFEAWPKTRKFPKLFGKIVVAFGSPIQAGEGMEKRAAQTQILEESERAIRALKNWVENGARGTPP